MKSAARNDHLQPYTSVVREITRSVAQRTQPFRSAAGADERRSTDAPSSGKACSGADFRDDRHRSHPADRRARPEGHSVSFSAASSTRCTPPSRPVPRVNESATAVRLAGPLVSSIVSKCDRRDASSSPAALSLSATNQGRLLWRLHSPNSFVVPRWDRASPRSISS